MQYTLPLALPPRFRADNFIVSACNREAWQQVHNWASNPEHYFPYHAMILYGPSGSGKSHLGHIWAELTGGRVIRACDIENLQPGEIGAENWLIEDIEQLSNERTLLHFLNAAKENGARLLLSSAPAPGELPFRLADLTSRLRALPHAHIHQPDEEALAGAMQKQFSDRQMRVEDEVIHYILARTERSFQNIKALVEQLDVLALAEHKKITIPFVKRLVEN